jgi:hypothetical protein
VIRRDRANTLPELIATLQELAEAYPGDVYVDVVDGSVTISTVEIRLSDGSIAHDIRLS